MHYDEEHYEKLFEKFFKERRIRETNETFKIQLFLEKSQNSLLIAQHHKEKEPAKDEATKIHWQYWAITITYYAMLYAAKAAIIKKGYDAKDHLAAQIALGKLYVDNEITQEDLKLLGEAHKIFEEEYITYFSDAREESHHARYSAIKKYTQRRVEQIFTNAKKFIAKIQDILLE